MRIIILFWGMLCCIGLPSYAQKQYLTSGWHVRESTQHTWYPAEIPGTIHTDLMRARLIPDPFLGTNEKLVQWVGERSWVYETSFVLEPHQQINQDLYLVFEGLDTYTKIIVNDSVLLETDNMFRTYRIPLKGIARANNRLRIIFYPAEKEANRFALASSNSIKRPCENNRHYARKAQFHFGWDWAPHLITCGIWRPVYLSFNLPAPPVESVLSPVTLIQEKDTIGQSFYFTLQGRPLFMKGANWIPADVFLPRVTKDRYRNLLFQAKNMGMNMLRVWGGGVYESDDFYTLCDSLGIWVWQDFMFAGAMYPATDSNFRRSVLAEIRDNVLRLRKHPCIVLWCGNNEIDEAWHNWGWQKQYGMLAKDSQFLWREYQSLFHEAIPALLHVLDPGRPYISSSPLHGWGRDVSMQEGDSHYWGVWWGLQPKETFQQKVPRFMSEFGMQAMPDFETAKQFGLCDSFSLACNGLLQHQKHPTGFATIETYLKQNSRLVANNTWQSYIDATQLMQADVLLEALQAQQESNGRCMGSLIWQLNDCWPVCSWSLIDYYGRPKKAVSIIKKYWHP